MMKNLKILLSMLLVAALLCPMLALAEGAETADEPVTADLYWPGMKMDDFTATLCDGTEVSLYELLETKQAVLINFWATWCGPCGMEFPFMEEAYLNHMDEIAVVALSIEDTDTADVIKQFKLDNGIIALPMGHDDNDLISRMGFYEGAIPMSLLVDRFGVICWSETGSIDSTDKFERLFAGFLGDDYTESKVGYTIPGPKPTVDPADPAALDAALNVEGGTLAFRNDEDENIWFFLPTEDGTLASSNAGVNETTATVKTTVTAKVGDALAFDYKTSTEDCMDHLMLKVNGEMITVFNGENDWSTYAYPFAEDGEYEIALSYVKDAASEAGADTVWLDNVRILTGDEAAAATANLPIYPQVLEGREYELRILGDNAKKIAIFDAAGNDVTMETFGTDIYVANADSIDCKALLGKELNPATAVGYGDFDYIPTSMNKAEHDDEGFFFSVALSTVEAGGYSNTYLFLFPDGVNEPMTMDVKWVFANEENTNYFVYEELPQYDMGEFTWKYADGTEPSTDVRAVPAEVETVPEGFSPYTLTVVDQNGDAVANTMLQVCDAETCDVFPTDENGIAAFAKAPYAYEVHVLMLPEGYTYEGEDPIVLEEAGCELTIKVTKAE